MSTMPEITRPTREELEKQAIALHHGNGYHSTDEFWQSQYAEGSRLISSHDRDKVNEIAEALQSTWDAATRAALNECNPDGEDDLPFCSCASKVRALLIDPQEGDHQS